MLTNIIVLDRVITCYSATSMMTSKRTGVHVTIHRVIRRYKRVLWYISLTGFIFTVLYSTCTYISKRIYPYGKNILNYLPSVSESSNCKQIPFLSYNITRQFLELPKKEYKDKVAILTPIRQGEMFLDKYGLQVSKLSYPHGLLSLYFGEDGSTDKTFEKANIIANYLKREHHLNHSAVIRLNISGGVYGSRKERHRVKVQLSRRAHLAMSRNILMQFSLRQNNFDYILWIDSDVTEFPSDLVQQMLFAKSDVVATPCLRKQAGYKWKYDWNSWRETNASIEAQSNLAPDELVVDNEILRVHLQDLKAEGRVVHLHGVGGCALMVKADCFRNGLKFPEKVYKHNIETEGLAKMANDMGYSVVGLPFVEVYHRFE